MAACHRRVGVLDCNRERSDGHAEVEPVYAYRGTRPIEGFGGPVVLLIATGLTRSPPLPKRQPHKLLDFC